ncbi:MAG: 2TM domain-containing protein, partial [Myxococcota bacterium]
MPHDWDDWEKWRARHRHGRPDWSRPGRGDRRAERNEARDAERARRREKRRGRELSPEEEAYRQARRAAEQKIAFFRHLVPYVCVVLFLTLVSWRVGAIVALAWGVGLASHYFQVFVAPNLRRRWVQGEVERQVARSVSRQRIALEDEKLRSLEELSA